MDADDLEAAVSAADARMERLWKDLRVLVERTSSRTTRPRGARPPPGATSERSGLAAAKLTASTDWDELFGGTGDDASDGEHPPEPRRVPSANPTSRGPRVAAVPSVSPSPRLVCTLSGSETVAATRTMLAREITPRPTSSDDAGATLRRAVEDILRAEDGRARLGGGGGGGDVETRARANDDDPNPEDAFEETLRREKRATRELREGMARMLERRRRDAAAAIAAEPSPSPTPADVVFHRGAQTDPPRRTRFDDVFIDPSLTDGQDHAIARGRAGKGATAGAGWVRAGARSLGGSAAAAGPRLRPRQPLGSTAATRGRGGRANAPRPSRTTWAADDDLSAFEEGCAAALWRHLESLDITRRRAALSSWGAADGAFARAQMCVRVELMLVSGGETDGVDAEGRACLLRQGSRRFAPVQAQPLRRVRVCAGGVAESSAHGFVPLGWIDVDYDENGRCGLPPLRACVVYRTRVAGGETEAACRHFAHFPLREHAPVFARAVRLGREAARGKTT